MVFDVLLVVVGISNLLEVAADHRGRFVMLGYRHCFIAFVASGYENVSSHEVHEVRALEQQLRHPCVVVVGARDVAVGAALGFFPSHRVRDERAEGLSAESFRGNGLLLIVEPVAVIVLRTDQHRAGGTHRRHAIARHRAVNAEGVDVVAQNLKVVGCPVARGQAFVVQHRHALVRAHRKMAAIAGRRPRGMAGVASHPAVLVSEFGFISSWRRLAPGLSVLLDGLRQARFFAVMRDCRE
jgi:hypothetical protein